MTEPGGSWTDHAHPMMERDDWFIRQANAFLDATEGVQAPLCGLEEGLATLRMNLAVLESVRSGTWRLLPKTAYP